MTASAQTLPGVHAGSLAWGLVLAALACWRWLPFPWALGVSLVALAVCILAARALHGDARWLWRFAALPAGCAALLVIAPHLPGLWPCDIGCGGGGGYARLGRMPTVLVGLLAALVIPLAAAARALARGRSGGAAPPFPTPQRIPPLVAAWGWLLLGASAYFIVTALRLQLQCRQCGAFQTASLSLVGVLLAGPLAGWSRLLYLAGGFMLMTLCYGTAVHEDVQNSPLPPAAGLPASRPDPTATATATRDSDLAWRTHADAGRRWGQERAAVILELALDFQCPHCAAQFDTVMGVVQPDLTQGRLQLEIRTVVRPSEPASPTIAAWSFAAAAGGEHRRFVAAMLGSREDASADSLLHSPAGETIDLPSLARAAEVHMESCRQLTDDDQRHLHALGYRGETPFAVLLDRSGHIYGRWSGSIERQALSASIHASLEGHR